MKTILITYFFLFFISISNTCLAEAHHPISIVADFLEVSQDQSIATCRGHVLVTQDNLTLSADQMIIHYLHDSNEPKKNAIERIEIKGNVILTTSNKTATSNTGTFDQKKNTLQLNGSVILKHGQNVIEGDKLVYNITSGVAQMFSDHNKIKAVIVQQPNSAHKPSGN